MGPQVVKTTEVGPHSEILSEPSTLSRKTLPSALNPQSYPMILPHEPAAQTSNPLLTQHLAPMLNQTTLYPAIYPLTPEPAPATPPP